MKKFSKNITEIIIHCTATPEGRDLHVADITRYHLQRGFDTVGYHYIIAIDGTVEQGRDTAFIGAHCLGHNDRSIGIAYIGGTDRSGNPKDTRTEAQRRSLAALVRELKQRYPRASVHGHSEFAAKACPCFDVASEFAVCNPMKSHSLLPLALLALSVMSSACSHKVTQTANQTDDRLMAVRSMKAADTIHLDRYLSVGLHQPRLTIVSCKPGETTCVHLAASEAVISDTFTVGKHLEVSDVVAVDTSAHDSSSAVTRRSFPTTSIIAKLLIAVGFAAIIGLSLRGIALRR